VYISFTVEGYLRIIPRYGVLHHASKREHGALRGGIARHAQRSKSFMMWAISLAVASVVACKNRLVRMMAENFGKCFGKCRTCFPAWH